MGPLAESPGTSYCHRELCHYPGDCALFGIARLDSSDYSNRLLDFVSLAQVALQRVFPRWHLDAVFLQADRGQY
jgi:hypothetical protein